MKLFPDPDCLPGYEAVPAPVTLRYGAYSEPHDTHLSRVSGTKPAAAGSSYSPFPYKMVCL
jgi:hypothetical protein